MNNPGPEEPFAEYPLGDELDLHTFAVREVKSLVEEYLFQCRERGFAEVRIIHGKGIGTQRRIVHGVLEKSPHVSSFSEAPPELGGWGATMVRLKGPSPGDEMPSCFRTKPVRGGASWRRLWERQGSCWSAGILHRPTPRPS